MRSVLAHNTGPALPVHVYATLATLPQGVNLDAATLAGLLDQRLPKLGPQQRARVLDAAAIGSYRVQQEVPVIDTLIADAAPQFGGVTADLQGCHQCETKGCTDSVTMIVLKPCASSGSDAE